MITRDESEQLRRIRSLVTFKTNFVSVLLVTHTWLYMRVCPSVRPSVRPWVSRFYNRGIQVRKWFNFHQWPCPTCMTNTVGYTALLCFFFLYQLFLFPLSSGLDLISLLFFFCFGQLTCSKPECRLEVVHGGFQKRCQIVSHGLLQTGLGNGQCTIWFLLKCRPGSFCS